MRAVLALALLAAGCGRLGFSGRGDADGDATPGEDVAASSDGPQPDAPDDAPFVCGALSQMADSFDDPALDAAKWTVMSDTGMTIGKVSGVLRIALAPSDPALRYAHYISACTYDGRGRAIAVTAARTPAVSMTAEMAFCMTHIDTMYRQICIDVNNGTTVAIYNSGGNPTTLASKALDPVNDRHWQIREQSGTVFWELSADGMAWTTFHSAPAPTDLSTMNIEIVAGTFGSVASPGTAEYDDLAIQ